MWRQGEKGREREITRIRFRERGRERQRERERGQALGGEKVSPLMASASPFMQSKMPTSLFLSLSLSPPVKRKTMFIVAKEDRKEKTN